jgi:hypothetical protein
VRLGVAQGKASTEGVDFRLRQGGWLAAGASDKAHDTGNLEDADALAVIDAHEEIAGKERQIEGNCGSVAPLATSLIEGDVVLDLLDAEVLACALFMARRGVDGKPFGREILLWRALDRGPGGGKNEIFARDLRQRLASLRAGTSTV